MPPTSTQQPRRTASMDKAAAPASSRGRAPHAFAATPTQSHPVHRTSSGRATHRHLAQQPPPTVASPIAAPGTAGWEKDAASNGVAAGHTSPQPNTTVGSSLVRA
eukprot:TRINITY_DN32688_c0_g1_i1.p1 TRINITY_DN32688_c0_g1~~TRINITY_DN32688_c0_g1_i1.p1  ORF type:complete len:117 (-),score=18.34 TRINITY_DN32688_c0_g1_i1:382-696(-)